MSEKKILLDSLDSKKLDGKTMDDLLPSFKPYYTPTPHDAPCPKQTTDDIKDCPLVNEWVFNHLPLSEDQKQKMRSQLIADAAKAQKKASTTPKCRLIGTRVKTQDKPEQRTSVKELTKHT